MMIDDALQAIVDDEARPLAGLAALALLDGKILYEGYFGRRHMGPDLPVTAATKFRVASISKVVTTLGVMTLVEDGRFDLDADISDYLGFALRHPHWPGRPITGRMLLSHRGSLRDGRIYAVPIPFTLRDFFLPDGAFFDGGEHFGAQEPGRFFTYCNLNFGVVATAMENITGMRFDDYMRAAVFDPLGVRCGFNVSALDETVIGEVATLYRQSDEEWVAQVDDFGGVRPAAVSRPENPDVVALLAAQLGEEARPLSEYQVGTNGTLFSPQGGLRASARDLAAVLRPERVASLTAEQWRFDGTNGDTYGGLMQSWGLSVQRFTGAAGGDRPLAGDGRLWCGHLGEAYGLLSGWLFQPETGRELIYIISGTSAPLEAYKGEYSALTRWEEEIIKILTSI